MALYIPGSGTKREASRTGSHPYDTLEDPLLVYGHNEEIQFANRAALNFFQLRADQLVGKSSTRPHWLMFHRDGKSCDEVGGSMIGSIVREKSAQCFLIGLLRTAPLQGDIRWAQFSATPSLNAEGKVDQVIVMLKEVPAQGRAGAGRWPGLLHPGWCQDTCTSTR